MKKFGLKLFLTLVLLTCISCFIDFSFSRYSPTPHFLSYKIQNLNAFPNYNFYFTHAGNAGFRDAILASEGKVFYYDASKWMDIGMYGQDKKTGQPSELIFITGKVDTTILISIDKMQGEKFDVSTAIGHIEPKTFIQKPTSLITKIFLLLSICVLLTYTAMLIFGKEKTTL